MGKKSKSKTPGEVHDNTAADVEEEKSSSSLAKNLTSEIEGIFAAKKRKTTETERAKRSNEDAAEKPESVKAKKPTCEIDEIFGAAKKKKKPETAKAKKRNEGGIENPNRVKKMKKGRGGVKDGGFVDLPSQPKKRTQDGLAIYTEEELGLAKADAGNTPLCPFDCSCCF